MKNRTILVTGAFGFIGSHLVERLAQENRVTAVGHAGSHSFGKNVTCVVCDLNSDTMTDLVRNGKFDVIFHLGSNVDIARSIRDPLSDFESNASATLRLLETLRIHSKKTLFVYASSIGVYGDADTLLHESTMPTPISPYGVSKLTGDHYCKVYAGVYGLKTVVIRYSTAFGPRLRRQFVYDTLTKLESSPDKIQLFGTGKQLRDLNYVSNHVDGTILVAERAEHRGEVYNIGYGKTYTLLEVATALRECLRSSAAIVPTGHLRAGEVQNFQYDISKAKALGYAPSVNIWDGLYRTVAWFQEEWVMQHKLPSVTVVICTYNEHANIRPTVDRITPWLQKVAKQHQILFVDDNSPDGTAAAVRSLAAKNPAVSLLWRKRKEGIGAAMRAGTLGAKSDVIITMDADLSQDPQEFIAFAYHLQHGARMVIGSRYLGRSKIVGQPFKKRMASTAGNHLARAMLRIRTRDLTHSYRAFYKRDFMDLERHITANGHPNYLLELTTFFSRSRKPIVEVPVIFTEREAGASKLKMGRAGREFAKAMLRLMRVKEVSKRDFKSKRPAKRVR